MKLFVKTQSVLEAIGLVHWLSEEYGNCNAASNDTIGVLIDNEDYQCRYIHLGEVIDSSANVMNCSDGLKAILDALSEVERFNVSGTTSVIVRVKSQHVELEGESPLTLTFDDIEQIRARIRKEPNPQHPDSLVGEVVSFDYYRSAHDWKCRVVLVKEVTDLHIKGLDVLDNFKFKSFTIDSVRDLKVVR